MAYKSLFLFVFTCLASTAFAQPCPPGCVTSIIPIDGGIVFLAAAGAILGYKKIRSGKA